jgi:hypothetical protein
LRGYGELDDDAVAGALWTRREGGAQRKNDRPLLEMQRRFTTRTFNGRHDMRQEKYLNIEVKEVIDILY